jgi:hypothetical protein
MLAPCQHRHPVPASCAICRIAAKDARYAELWFPGQMVPWWPRRSASLLPAVLKCIYTPLGESALAIPRGQHQFTCAAERLPSARAGLVGWRIELAADGGVFGMGWLIDSGQLGPEEAFLLVNASGCPFHWCFGWQAAPGELAPPTVDAQIMTRVDAAQREPFQVSIDVGMEEGDDVRELFRLEFMPG